MMTGRDDQTPTNDASVVGATAADLDTTVRAFFAAFVDRAEQPLERLSVNVFFDTLLAPREADDESG